MKHLKYLLNEDIIVDMSDGEINEFNKKLEEWRGLSLDEMNFLKWAPTTDEYPFLYFYIDKYLSDGIFHRGSTIFIRKVGDIESNFEMDISYLEDLKWLKDNDRYNREAIEDGYTQEKIEILIKAFGEIFENRLAAFKWDW